MEMPMLFLGPIMLSVMQQKFTVAYILGRNSYQSNARSKSVGGHKRGHRRFSRKTLWSSMEAKALEEVVTALATTGSCEWSSHVDKNFPMWW